MAASPILFPQRLHFTCRRCAGCCRGWTVTLTEEEAAPLRGINWAATRPRFDGRQALQPLADGRFRLAHVGDACIFLDEDNLCAVHKELGPDAKPRMCRQFPLRLVETPEGIVASLDFACPAVVADDGAPIEEQEVEVRRLANLAMAARAPDRLSMAAPRTTLRAGAVLRARRGVPLAWADYRALEATMRELLQDPTPPLTRRMLRIDRLGREAHQHVAPGALPDWLAQLRAAGWAPLDAPLGPAPTAMRQRALLAPLIAGLEGGRLQEAGGRSSARGRIALAVAIVGAQEAVRLPTADATLPLREMQATRFDQDGALAPTLARFMEALLVRKVLVDGVSLIQGVRYLALYFGAVRWYAVARAVLAGRVATTEEDLRYAIALVERRLTHSEGFRTPRLNMLLNLLFEWVAPSHALYPSPYPA